MLHDAASVRYLAICGLLLFVSSAPVLVGTHPPLTDYPFYIARVFILSELDANPFVAEHYARSSFLIPNIGAELILVPLSALLPYEIAFDVFLS
jgi:hypothetical protein